MPYPPDDDDDLEPEPFGDGLEAVTEWPSLDVEITEPGFVGEILGPDGDVLATVYDRTVVPFGFQVPG